MKNETKSFLSLFEKIAPKTAKYHDNQLEFYKNTLKTKLDLAFTFQEKKDIIINEIDKVKSSEAASEFEEVYSIDIPTFIQYFQNIQQMAKSMPNAIKKKLDSQDQKIVNLLSKEFDLSKLLDLTEVVESDESKIKEFVFEMQNISKGSEEIGSIEKELIQNASDLMNNLDPDFDLENFGGVLSYKLKNDLLHYLYEELDSLESSSFVSKNSALPPKRDTIIDESWRVFKPKTPPEGFIEIKSSLTEEEILKFFSFLYLEKNGEDKAFITFEQYKQLLEYGLSIPNKTNTSLITIEKSTQKPLGIIYYCIYKFFLKNRYNSNEKLLYAKFLKYNFTNFSLKTIKYIAENIRDKKPAKMKFKIEKYLP